jgi:copper chaperone CopZ
MTQNAQVLRLEPRSTRRTLWDLSAVRLRIDGMGCTHCEERIRQGLLASPGVRGARVELESATAAVVFDPSRLTVDEVLEIIEQIGSASGHAYTAVPVSAVSVNTTNGGTL